MIWISYIYDYPIVLDFPFSLILPERTAGAEEIEKRKNSKLKIKMKRYKHVQQKFFHLSTPVYLLTILALKLALKRLILPSRLKLGDIT